VKLLLNIVITLYIFIICKQFVQNMRRYTYVIVKHDCRFCWLW